MKHIHDEKISFYEMGEPLAYIPGAVQQIMSSCLYINDEFKDFKECVANSLNYLRDAEEIYGFPKIY